jgi:chemotaxis protein MotA
MEISSRLWHFIISFGCAFIFWLILMFVADSLPEIGFKRILIIFGGTSNGYIQMLTIAAFLFGMLDLGAKSRLITREREGFYLNLLPVGDQAQLSPKDVSEIRSGVAQIEQRGFRYLIADFIKKTCNQYRNDESIGETLHVIGAQISNSKAEAESRLEVTRYVISAISALGFIGTVMGLADSIGLAHLASDPEKIKMITGSLYVAFDTTLVALLLSLVLTYRYHVYLEMLDSFYSQSEAYIIENLVSRIKKDA